MISFEAPAYLHLAWAVPVLAAAYLLRRRAAARAAGSAALTRGRSRPVARLRRGLRLLALGALVLALANPRPEQARRPAPAKGPGRIVFLIDVSNSMLASDVLPDRLTQAKKVVAEAVHGLQGQEVALAVFAGNAQLYVPLTTDYEVVSRACTTISPALVPRQGTSLAEALALAALVLKPSPRQRQVACVLSDGESHAPRFAALADSLSKAGVDIFSIGIGTPKGTTLPANNSGSEATSLRRDRQGRPIVSRLQEDNMKRITQGRPDRYIRLDNWRNTTARFLRELRKLDPSAAQPKSTGPAAYFQYCLLAAFLLLVLELLLPRAGNIDFKP